MKGELEPRKVILTCLLLGFIVGVIGAIPIIWIPNLCCLWIIAGGFMSAYVLGRSDKNIELADGFIIGAIFGVSYAVFNEVAYHIVKAFLGIAGIGMALQPQTTLHLARGAILTIVFFVLNILVSFFTAGVGGLIYSVFVKGDKGRPRHRPKTSLSGGRR